MRRDTRVDLLGSSIENGMRGSRFFECEYLCLFRLSRAFRFIEEEQIHEPKLLLIVGCIGLLVNVIGLLLLYGESCVPECLSHGEREFHARHGVLFTN